MIVLLLNRFNEQVATLGYQLNADVVVSHDDDTELSAQCSALLMTPHSHSRKQASIISGLPCRQYLIVQFLRDVAIFV